MSKQTQIRAVLLNVEDLFQLGIGVWRWRNSVRTGGYRLASYRNGLFRDGLGAGAEKFGTAKSKHRILPLRRNPGMARSSARLRSAHR